MNRLFVTIALVAACILGAAQEKKSKNIILGVNYDKPLEEHVLSYVDGDTIESTHCYYTYEGDSLKRVDVRRRDPNHNIIVEWEWIDKTHTTYCIQDGYKWKAKEIVYNDNMQVVSYYSDHFQTYFGKYAFFMCNKSFFFPTLQYTRKYNEKGLMTEEKTTLYVTTEIVKRITYDDKKKTINFENYYRGVRVDTTDAYLKADVYTYYDDDYKKKASYFHIKHNGELGNGERYYYYDNDSLKATEIISNGKKTNTLTRIYDDQGRLVKDNLYTYDYTNFIKKGPYGITIKYLDDKFDKMVSCEILGSRENRTYDKYRRPLTTSLENGTRTDPDYDATYTYDDNVVTCIRHERGWNDKKGEKSVHVEIRIVYAKED